MREHCENHFVCSIFHKKYEFREIHIKLQLIKKFIILKEIISCINKFHQLDLTFEGDFTWKNIYYKVFSFNFRIKLYKIMFLILYFFAFL